MTNNLYHNKTAQWITYLIVFGFLAVVPFITDNLFTLNQLARFCALGMLAMSVSVIWGFGGVLSLGQGVAFGMAAYGMGMTMQMQSQDPISNPIPTFMISSGIEVLPALWAPFSSTSMGLILTLAVPTIFFVVFGILMFQARVAGVFVAIMTLATCAAWYNIAYDMQPYTAGFNGLSPPAFFQIGGWEVDPYSPSAYWICVAFLAGLALAIKALLETRFGLIIQAIRDDSERARFLGYNVAYYQVVLFAISGFVAACAGLCWVMIVQYVSPTSFEIVFSISIVIWAAVGGRTSLIGAAAGAFLINGMQSYLGDELRQVWSLMLGGMFILIVLFLPNGLSGLFEKIFGALARQSGNVTNNKTSQEVQSVYLTKEEK
jgi:urea transport system permease protein